MGMEGAQLEGLHTPRHKYTLYRTNTHTIAQIHTLSHEFLVIIPKTCYLVFTLGPPKCLLIFLVFRWHEKDICWCCHCLSLLANIYKFCKLNCLAEQSQTRGILLAIICKDLFPRKRFMTRSEKVPKSKILKRSL